MKHDDLLRAQYQLGLDFALDILAMRREDLMVENADNAESQQPPAFAHGYLAALDELTEFLSEADPLQLCEDCSASADYYMVTDELWSAATARTSAGTLCIACLEDRVGRRLVRADFPSNISVNQVDGPWSEAMTPRLLLRLA